MAAVDSLRTLPDRHRAWTLAALSVLTWPVHGRSEAPGVDAAWRAALHLAADRRMSFGTDVAYVYGPLGFLTHPNPPYVGWVWIVGLLYGALVQVALVVAVFWAARRACAPWLAVAITYAVAALSTFAGAERIQIPMVIASVAIARGEYSARTLRWVVPVLGLASGVALLGKLNGGVLVFVAAAIAIAAAERRRIVVFLATVAGTSLAGWFATGNGLRDLWEWLAATREIFGGYASSMNNEAAADRRHYALLPLTLLALLPLLWRARRSLDRTRSVAVVLIGVWVVFLAYKHGFVRHSGAYGRSYFVLVFALVWAFLLSGPLRRLDMLCIGIISLCLVGAVGVGRLETLNPVEHLRSFGNDEADLFVPGRLRDHIEEFRQERQADYGLDGPVFEALRGHTVHIDPTETGVAWAYPELDWSPLPVFHSFTAYTPALDERNAERLRSERAPERILRPGRANLGSVDGRLIEFDSPVANLEMLCRYREIAVDSRWQVLDRVDNRCSEARLVNTVEATLGQRLKVPAASTADAMVVARFRGVDDSVVGKLQALLFKSTEIQIVSSVDPFAHRFLTTTADGPLVMRAASTLGWTAGYGFDQPIDEFLLQAHNGIAFDKGYTVEFYEIRVKAAR